MYHDEATIEAMNAMQMSISAVGNHELDEGAPELLRMERGGCHPVDGCSPVGTFRGAKYAYLAANIVRTDTHKTLFPPVAIRKIGGVKIGFIGETLHGTPEIVSAKYERPRISMRPPPRTPTLRNSNDRCRRRRAVDS